MALYDKDTCEQCGKLVDKENTLWIDDYSTLICHRCVNALIDALRANQVKAPE